MASIIKGYSYDIFISYRQKDNKYDGWVTEFVENLKKELEATFKEEISVYFDINPYDGLLETHDVDESLKEKLKCLVFIPIISRIYCDPKSFAWEHEFKAFIEIGSKDQFGLKVKLPNGNVASRVLPIRIYNLDAADIKLCESVLGGVLRGVEFIYKSAGVNRPLTPSDNPDKNLCNTFYRDQINKVSNAIKEIISGMKGEPLEFEGEPKEFIATVEKPNLKEKSIIVLPFENISQEPNQDYFSDGLTEEIITDLSHIHDLLVISRSSAMTFKGTKKTVPEIAQAVKVRYVLEGSVRKAGNNLRITAQLIDSTTDTHLWAEKYTGILDDIFNIQEKVSQSITQALRIKLSSEEKKKIEERPISNVLAYDYYLKAQQYFYDWNAEHLNHALQLLENGLKIAGENEYIYYGLGFVNFQMFNLGLVPDYSLLEKSEEYANKIFQIDANSPLGFKLLGMVSVFKESVQKVANNAKKAIDINPNDYEALYLYAFCLNLSGKNKETYLAIISNLQRGDPFTWLYQWNLTLHFVLEGNYKRALEELERIYSKESGNPVIKYYYAYCLAHYKYYKRSFELFDEVAIECKDMYIGPLCNLLKYAFQNKREKALTAVTPSLIMKSKIDWEVSWLMAECYAMINEKELAIDYIECAVNRGLINYPFWAEKNIYIENLRGDERFKKLMKRVIYEWENFEI